MGKSVVITSRHDLGVEGAKRRISDRYEALTRAYMDRIGRSELVWSGDVGLGWATSLGQKATFRIDVAERDLRIEIILPWMLAPLAGMIESVLRGNEDALRPDDPPRIASP